MIFIEIMALKLPPPIIMLFCIFVAELMQIPLSFSEKSPNLNLFFAGVFLLISLLVDIFSFYSFRKAHTTVNPMQPDRTSVLVQTGIFRYSRNPMYLSLVGYLITHTFWRENATSLLLVVPFMLYITHFQILPEERILTAKFGEQYRQYQQKVRRWI